MNEQGILIACRKLPDITHARLTGTWRGIVVEFGRFVGGRFIMFSYENNTFNENPELRDIWNGFCWNIAELALFVAHMDCYDNAEEVAI